jgi:ketosteroid isomerase-like protein
MRFMIITSLRTNHLSGAAFDWYASYLAAFEARNIERYLSYLAEDCVVQTNSRMPLYGHAGLRDPVQRYFEAYAVVHDLLNIYGDDNQFAAEMLTHYTPRGASKPISIPTVSIYDRAASGTIHAMRHYVDDTPLSA